jgi:hypothetical protein
MPFSKCLEFCSPLQDDVKSLTVQWATKNSSQLTIKWGGYNLFLEISAWRRVDVKKNKNSNGRNVWHSE